MASGEIRPRSILRPGSNYEQPPVFGRARTAGSTKSASSSTNSTSTELGSRIKRTFGLNKSTNSPSKISTPRSSTSERAKPKADAESKNTDRASTTSTRPAIEPLDTNKLQALSSQVSRFGRPPPVGQKSGLRVTENAGLSSHRRTQSVADSGPASAPLPQSKEVRSRFGFGSGSSSSSKQSSPPISTNSKKPTTLSKNAIDTIDTDDDFDVDRLVDGLRQEVRNESANNSVKEMARHRRHHSLMGSASIAGDVRAGWSAAASAALERARLRAASTNDPNATAITTAKSSTFERNGARSASGSFEEHHASRSGTPVSITSRQNNASSKQQRQQQQQQQQQQQSLTAMSLDSQRIPRGHQRRGNSDESVPTLSPSSSNDHRHQLLLNISIVIVVHRLYQIMRHLHSHLYVHHELLMAIQLLAIIPIDYLV
ncbi:hypothetical protein BDF19DRAFT_5314 [Syncephalis fuscata]|nr:hypothetical protein BDF19DRAFT_5314 [Syncephalis fuscata]